MHLKAPANEFQQADWDAWCPGARIGEPIDTPLNPVLYYRSDSNEVPDHASPAETA